jgi:integrase
VNRPTPGAVEDRTAPTTTAPTIDGRKLRGLIPVGVESRDMGGWREVIDRGALDNANLPRLTLHGARHTYASLMIAAGVNAKALSTFMGHAAIAITIDLYGHLMPGSEAQAADLLDGYLARSTVAPTVAQPPAATA